MTKPTRTICFSVLFMLLFVFLAACGSQPSQNPPVEGSSTSPPVAVEPKPPAPEAEPKPVEPETRPKPVDEPQQGGTEPVPPPEPEAKPEPVTHVVEIVNFAFSPASLEIKAGDTVTFINKDDVRHTATAEDKSFDTGMLGKDEEKSITFDTVGEFAYICLPHPAMKGMIIVK